MGTDQAALPGTDQIDIFTFGPGRGKRHEPRPRIKQPVNNQDLNNSQPKAGRRSKRTAAMALVSIVLLPAEALHASPPSYAAFLDAAPATVAFTASSLQAPTLTCANSGNNDVRLTLTHPGDSATMYELYSAVPARTWNAGSWTAGASINYTVDADHSAFNFNQTTNVTFAAFSKIGLWTSPEATKVATYTPETSILFIGLVPAKLRCAA